MNVDRAFNILSRVAEDIENEFTSHTAKIAAMICHKSKILAMGINCRKTHPEQLRYNDFPYVHAEINTISKVRNMNLSKTTMYIYRAKIHKTGKDKLWTQGMAKPCKAKNGGCHKAIIDSGISKVVFSLDNEGYGVINL